MSLKLCKFNLRHFNSGSYLDFGGGGQNLERRNVERLVFRNFKIANIKIKKGELFDNLILELFFFISQKIFEYLKNLMIFDIVRY